MATFHIQAIEALSADVKSFRLLPADGNPLSYTAGQFLTFLFRHTGQEVRRSYSFSSAMETDANPTITVKRTDNGLASRWLHDIARHHDVIEAIGPAGLFTLNNLPARTEQVFFYAAGIGITPVYSIIKAALSKATGPQLVLFYSNRSEAQAIFRNKLLALQEKHPQRLRIEWIYSSSKNLLMAHLTNQSLPLLLQRHLATAKENTAHYLCGPRRYEFLLRQALRENGIHPPQIRTENFTPDAIVIRTLPPDAAVRQAAISFQGKMHYITIAPPDTILQAAKKAGLSLPYSCESGRCGACAALCTSGNVWMSNDEVLAAADVARGLVLTCTGHPNGGDIAIQV